MTQTFQLKQFVDSKIKTGTIDIYENSAQTLVLKQFQKSTINDQDHDRIDGRNVVDDNRCVGDSFEMLMIES